MKTPLRVLAIYEQRSWFGETAIVGGYVRALRSLRHRVWALDRTRLLQEVARGGGDRFLRLARELWERRIDFILSCNLNGTFVFEAEGGRRCFHELAGVPQVVSINDLLPRFLEPAESVRARVMGALLAAEGTLFAPHREEDAAEIRLRGRPALHLPMAFDDRIRPRGPDARDIPVIFVGTVGDAGGRRFEALMSVRELGLCLFNGRAEPSVLQSPLGDFYRGRLSTLQALYGAYRRARLCVDLNDEEGMIPTRVFDAMGNGCLVLAPTKREIVNTFEPGRHLAVYEDPAEIPERVAFYLAHEAERERVAEAGRRHVLESHTYLRRAENLVRFVAPHLESKLDRDAAGLPAPEAAA